MTTERDTTEEFKEKLLFQNATAVAESGMNLSAITSLVMLGTDMAHKNTGVSPPILGREALAEPTVTDSHRPTELNSERASQETVDSTSQDGGGILGSAVLDADEGSAGSIWPDGYGVPSQHLLSTSDKSDVGLEVSGSKLGYVSADINAKFAAVTSPTQTPYQIGHEESAAASINSSISKTSSLARSEAGSSNHLSVRTEDINKLDNNTSSDSNEGSTLSSATSDRGVSTMTQASLNTAGDTTGLTSRHDDGSSYSLPPQTLFSASLVSTAISNVLPNSSGVTSAGLTSDVHNGVTHLTTSPLSIDSVLAPNAAFSIATAPQLTPVSALDTATRPPSGIETSSKTDEDLKPDTSAVTKESSNDRPASTAEATPLLKIPSVPVADGDTVENPLTETVSLVKIEPVTGAMGQPAANEDFSDKLETAVVDTATPTDETTQQLIVEELPGATVALTTEEATPTTGMTPHGETEEQELANEYQDAQRSSANAITPVAEIVAQPETHEEPAAAAMTIETVPEAVTASQFVAGEASRSVGVAGAESLPSETISQPAAKEVSDLEVTPPAQAEIISAEETTSHPGIVGGLVTMSGNFEGPNSAVELILTPEPVTTIGTITPNAKAAPLAEAAPPLADEMGKAAAGDVETGKPRLGADAAIAPKEHQTSPALLRQTDGDHLSEDGTTALTSSVPTQTIEGGRPLDQQISIEPPMSTSHDPAASARLQASAANANQSIDVIYDVRENSEDFSYGPAGTGLPSDIAEAVLSFINNSHLEDTEFLDALQNVLSDLQHHSSISLLDDHHIPTEPDVTNDTNFLAQDFVAQDWNFDDHQHAHVHTHLDHSTD